MACSQVSHLGVRRVPGAGLHRQHRQAKTGLEQVGIRPQGAAVKARGLVDTAEALQHLGAATEQGGLVGGELQGGGAGVQGRLRPPGGEQAGRQGRPAIGVPRGQFDGVLEQGYGLFEPAGLLAHRGRQAQGQGVGQAVGQGGLGLGHALFIASRAQGLDQGFQTLAVERFIAVEGRRGHAGGP